MTFSEAGMSTPPGSSVAGSARQFPHHIYNTRVPRASRSPAEIRSVLLGIRVISFESQGRITSSTGMTKTNEYLLARGKQLMNSHKLKCNDDTSSTALQVISIDLPPLDVDLREMYRPLLKIRYGGGISHRRRSLLLVHSF